MEPRFLSMTPDTGLADLTAEETGRFVRTLARSSQAQKQLCPMKKTRSILKSNNFGVHRDGSSMYLCIPKKSKLKESQPVATGVHTTHGKHTRRVGVGGFAFLADRSRTKSWHSDACCCRWQSIVFLPATPGIKRALKARAISKARRSCW